MAGYKMMALAAAVAILPLAAPAPQTGDELLVRAVRFYRAEVSLTQVKAFIQVPLSLMSPTVEGVLTYRVRVALKDSTGLTLSQDAWPAQHLSAGLQQPGAYTVNSFEVVLRPGRHRLEVTVEDSVSGKTVSTATEVTGYATQPRASDLVLSPGMRPMDDTAGPAGNEWRSGQILVTSVAYLRLNPTHDPRAFYLLEAYTTRPDSGSMQALVKDSTGRVAFRTRPTPVMLPVGGGVLRGQLNLEGLPSGTYTLAVRLQLSGDTVERAAGFTMADLLEAARRDSIRTALFRVTDSGYFAGMDEAQLDVAYEPLSYIASGRELRAYKDMSVPAKQRFLTEFWQKRDPDASTPRNEYRELFYGQLAYADSAFRERGQSEVPGWKSDRGRVYVKYGAPDEVLDRPRAGRAPPYIVWRFTRQRDLYYVFADRTGFGAYKLVHTNDRNELSLPDWIDLLTPDGVQDVGRFLGIDFFQGNQQLN
ncbi:MAG: GWxTD domain-containing protein [Gemmatimonadales bacterium]